MLEHCNNSVNYINFVVYGVFFLNELSFTKYLLFYILLFPLSYKNTKTSYVVNLLHGILYVTVYLI